MISLTRFLRGIGDYSERDALANHISCQMRTFKLTFHIQQKEGQGCRT